MLRRSEVYKTSWDSRRLSYCLPPPQLTQSQYLSRSASNIASLRSATLIISSQTICDFEDDSSTSGQCIKQVFYYYVAHFSKFVAPGSVRIDWSLDNEVSKDVETTAFLTPDDDVVVVIMNKGKDSAKLTLVDATTDGVANVEIPPHSINTLVYSISKPSSKAPAEATRKEGFVFHSKSGEPDDYYTQWDWDVVTTVATWHADDKTLVDYSHSKGAKVVAGVGVDISQVADEDYRKGWIDDHLSSALDWGTDGLNIDVENNNLSRDQKKGKNVRTTSVSVKCLHDCSNVPTCHRLHVARC